MKIEAVRQFVEIGVYAYNPNSGEANPFKECLRAIQRSQKICYQERVELIELFKARIQLHFDGEEAELWTKQAHQALNNRVEQKFVNATNMVALQVVAKTEAFIEQLVLDSKADAYAFTNQVNHQEAIVFYHKHLQAYLNLNPHQNRIGELIHVMAQALRFAFFLGVSQRLESHSLGAFFLEFEYQLKVKRLPYLLVPLQANARGLVLRINWCEGGEFSCVLINTGRDALVRNDKNQCMDIRFEGLRVRELKELIAGCLNFAGNPVSLYQRLAQNDLLKNYSWKHDRLHHMHRGVSSYAKSLASAIHGVLGTSLYRQFKCFLTECLLHGQMLSPDLQVIRARREWKALSHRQ